MYAQDGPKVGNIQLKVSKSAEICERFMHDNFIYNLYYVSMRKKVRVPK